MGPTARQGSSQERHKLERRIAGLMIVSLESGQLLQRPPTPLCQFHLLGRAERTGFARKLEPDLPSALQLRQRPGEAGMNCTFAIAALQRRRVKALLQFFIAPSDPTQESAHRTRELSFLAGALALAQSGPIHLSRRNIHD
jgi:hypothetical protein